MAVKDALDKIVDRHQDVIGAMVLANGQVHHNLETPYDEISADLILETLDEIFETTRMVAEEGHDYAEVIIDFSNHSLIVRTIEGGVLAVLSPRLQRGQLVKLHVGLGIFAKSVQKALAEAPESFESSVAAEPSDDTTVPPAEAEAPADTAADGDEFSLGFKRKSKGFRGTKEMLASRFQRAEAAVTEPQPKDPEEPQVNEEGVPLNADGTPKKKKMYRGQVYYE